MTIAFSKTRLAIFLWLAFSCNSHTSPNKEMTIGTGQATRLDEVAIEWPGNKTQQVFKQVPVDVIINIKQGEPSYTITRLKKFDFNEVTPKTVDFS